MFVVKSPVFLNGNKSYHKKKKFFKRYDKIHHPHVNNQNYDIRLIILRHADRIDLALGENWYEQVFGGGPSALTRYYQNSMLPHRLPRRSNTLLYEFDPPITRAGEQKAFMKGQQLSRIGANVDYCYSSPACRSIITANAILKGMNRSHVPIRLEPYLFEPMNWNTPFQALGDISPFMSTGDWIQSGYNMDRRYRRISDYLNPYETENDFLTRSQIFLQSIERYHGNARGQRSNILISGHAATPVIFSNIALRQPFDAESFGQQCTQIPFLHTIVLERNATSRIWSVRPIMS